MADCVFCGRPAGFLRSKHSECAAAHAESLEKLPQIFTGYINLAEAPDRPDSLRTAVEATAKEGFLSTDEFRPEIIKGLGLAIRAAVTDRSSLTDAELARIQEVMKQFGLETADIEASGAHDLLVQGLVLRDLEKAPLRSRFQVEGPIPINLKKDEVILWIFRGVSRLEPKTSVSYSGRSQAVSLRIMKGVSYRVGASKGHRIETPTLASKGSGDLYITSSAVYFVSSLGGYTVAHKKISAVEQLSDGISIEPSSGKSGIFLLSAPRFAAELILKIASCHRAADSVTMAPNQGSPAMPKPKPPTTDQLSAIASTTAIAPRKPLSSTTKTAMMAFAAFVTVYAVFSPARPPAPPDRHVLYTGCELRGAIKRCDEFTKAVSDGWTASYFTTKEPLPRIIGAPSAEEQITALRWQDDWFREKRKEEDRASTEEHERKIYHQEYERRGVKF